MKKAGIASDFFIAILRFSGCVTDRVLTKPGNFYSFIICNSNEIKGDFLILGIES